MLPKKERLTRAEFNRFFSVGKRINSPALQMVYAPHDSLHVSVVVSKKVARSAVKRNVIRRRIYDIVRRHRDESGLKGVIIFIVKQMAAQKSFEDLKAEVGEIISKTI